MRLAGKTILITGAASGIGAAAASHCAREGAHVLAVDRADADVADEDQVARLFAGIDRLDALVHCAGIAVRNTVEHQDAAGWDEVMRVNLRGSYLCARLAVAKMRPAGGSIVLLASVVGITGVRNRAAYSASKGAIVALTRNMALDYAQDRIRVNCLCPGFTRTPMTARLFSDPEREARITALHPLGRLGTPDDIASAIVFLASAESSWITGQAIAVDGGFSAGQAAGI